jgi:hypothetical protein
MVSGDLLAEGGAILCDFVGEADFMVSITLVQWVPYLQCLDATYG